MDGTAGVAADGDGDAGSDPKGGGPRPSTPLPAADRKYVCLRSLVGASSSSSSASREAMLPGARKVLDVGLGSGCQSQATVAVVPTPTEAWAPHPAPLLLCASLYSCSGVAAAMASTAAAGMPSSKPRHGRGPSSRIPSTTSHTCRFLSGPSNVLPRIRKRS